MRIRASSQWQSTAAIVLFRRSEDAIVRSLSRVPHLHLSRKVLITSAVLACSAATALDAEFGDLAGNYSGKTAKGGEIVIIVPKSGSPTYRFRGDPVLVSGA
jgi:hypothetical protein